MSRRPRKEVGGVQVRENKGRGRVEMGLWTLALVPFLWEGIAVCRCAGWHDCASVCLSPFSYAPPLFPLCLLLQQGRGEVCMPCPAARSSLLRAFIRLIIFFFIFFSWNNNFLS
jgi:hypothetical protein